MVRVLVTGFGAFPNAPVNPTARLVADLKTYRPRLARFGIRLEGAVLPVEYLPLRARLAALENSYAPDVLLLFGLAGRRTALSVETRAVNRLGLLHPDARGRLAGAPLIARGGPAVARARYPTARVVAALRRQGFAARLSIDAGDYVCNQALYLALAHSGAKRIGFIHVPGRRGHLTADALTQAALVAIFETVRDLPRA